MNVGRNCPVACIAAPFPPPVGGMAVQAEKLARRLESEGIGVIRLESFPIPPAPLRFVRRVRGLRTIVRGIQYLRAILKTVPESTVVHHLVGSGLSFFMHSAPLLLLCPIWKKRIVLNYRSGNAGEAFMRRWGWLAVPLMRRADELVVPHKFLQRVFEVHGLRASILPNIADTDLFPFMERRRFRPKFIVARHLTPIYDVECVIRAFAIIQRSYPDASLGVAGTGFEELRLKQVTRELGLENVTFYGEVENANMPALLAEYDIAINGSVMDNFPGALLESALSGLAIVSTDAGGIPDMIDHGVTGILTPVRDHKALAEAALETLADQEATHRRILAARRWAEPYCWNNVFQELMRVYRFPTEHGISGEELQRAAS